MNPVKLKSATLCFATCSLLVASAAQGAVMIEDTFNGGALGGGTTGYATDLGGGTYGYEFNFNPVTEFSAAGHDKLVLVISGRNFLGNQSSGIADFSSITYNGSALSVAISGTAIATLDASGSVIRSAIYYLDNVASDGKLRIELSSSAMGAVGFGLFAVDGLKAGVQDTGSSTDEITAAVTMTTDSGFFVQGAARNNGHLTDSVDDYFELFNYDVSVGNGDTGTNDYAAIGQYRVTTAAGDYYAPMTGDGASATRVVAAAFEAEVPEPSSLALMGLGGLLIARRRRA